MNKRALGTAYEQKAVTYLTENGFRILESNFYCRQGEIDIIGFHDDCLVFVDVKYRRNLQAGYPEEAVDLKKQMKICRASDYYRVRHSEHGDRQIRYDVVAICGEQVKWHQNAFSYVTGKEGNLWFHW